MAGSFRKPTGKPVAAENRGDKTPTPTARRDRSSESSRQGKRRLFPQARPAGRLEGRHMIAGRARATVYCGEDGLCQIRL